MATLPRFILVPHGLDLWGVLPTRLRRRQHVDGARLILHRVNAGSQYSRNDRWTGLGHAEASVLAGGWRHCEPMKAALCGGGILECSNDHEPGVKTDDYRLTDRWDRAPLDRYVPNPPGILDRLAEGRKAAKKKRTEKGEAVEPERPRHPVHDHFQSWVERVRLDDRDAERALLRIEPGEPRERAAKVAALLASNDPGTREAWPCRFGRLHHILTNKANKELRQAGTIDGERLSECDVRNTQPLVAALLAAEWWTASHKPQNIRDAQGEAGGREGGGGTGGRAVH